MVRVSARFELARVRVMGSLLYSLRAARSIFLHALEILNFHGDTLKMDSSNYKALFFTHFLAHLRCPHEAPINSF